MVSYRNTESLRCVTGANIVLVVNYSSKTSKLIENEVRFVVVRDSAGGRWEERALD